MMSCLSSTEPRHIMPSKILATATALILAFAPGATAQSGQDSSAVLRAAVSVAARDLVSPGASIAISPLRAKNEPSWPEARVTAWAKSIGAQVASAADSVRCPGGPGTCYAPSNAQVMQVYTPDFLGDSARVSVNVQQTKTGREDPYAGRMAEMWFIRKDGAWTFLRHGMIALR